MTDKTIENVRVVGGDYFKLQQSRRSDLKLDYYLDKFNIDEYDIYKYSRRFKKVTKEDLYEFKYAGYLLIRKDYKHSTDKYINSKIDLGFTFLGRSMHIDFPYDKIKIIGSL